MPCCVCNMMFSVLSVASSSDANRVPAFMVLQEGVIYRIAKCTSTHVLMLRNGKVFSVCTHDVVSKSKELDRAIEPAYRKVPPTYVTVRCSVFLFRFVHPPHRQRQEFAGMFQKVIASSGSWRVGFEPRLPHTSNRYRRHLLADVYTRSCSLSWRCTCCNAVRGSLSRPI